MNCALTMAPEHAPRVLVTDTPRTTRLNGGDQFHPSPSLLAQLSGWSPNATT